ncbi:pentatricopeptide repeat-containing protein At3g51320 [Euphorbia lathyris]|uniref:pentatricopeptide repeat-containing protein At3g51320 n=1 Tax=Euphorbia lathyris TaxID=212925 RepID=UPI003313C80D
MARFSMRNLFRIGFRNAIQFSSVLPHTKPYSSSYTHIEGRPCSFYHPSIALLKSCQNSSQLFQLQSQLIISGFFPFWSDRLLKRFSDFGDIYQTLTIFRYIDSPDTLCVNCVIKAYSISSIPEQSVVFYFERLRNGFSPNSYTFVSLFGCCAKIGCAQSAQKFHGQAAKYGVDSVLQVQNSMVHMYGNCGVVGLARKVFDEMPKWDLVSRNSMIDAYASNGNLAIAHNMFDVMPESNVVSWNIMIHGYLKGYNPGCSLMLFRRMVNSGLIGNDKTMVSVLSACGKSARLNEGRSVHGFLIRTLLNFSLMINTSLIDMYSKCQKVELARRIFDTIVYRNVICWNAMILGHCIHGNPEDGLNLFAEMVHCGAILPDEVTYIGILCACARAGLLTEGRNFFNQMLQKYSIKPNFAHYWCMANLYAGCGLIEEAENILRNIPEDNEIVSSESLIWANLLTSCRFQANASLGERIAKSLIEMEPWNFSHYQLLLNVYSAAGKWDDVAGVKAMVKERKIGRMPGCNLVDLKDIVHKYRVRYSREERCDEINEMTREEVAQRPNLQAGASKCNSGK